jgi:hypothetical protein
MLTLPEPLMKFMKPSYIEMWNRYGSRATSWFQSLEATAIGFPLLTVGAVAVSISFLVSALVWVFAHCTSQTEHFKKFKAQNFISCFCLRSFRIAKGNLGQMAQTGRWLQSFA